MGRSKSGMISPLASYEAAIAALAASGGRDDLEHKHKAVLALTRANSLDFARAEYHRYELDRIRHHEDIMALGGRLFKDLYRASSGQPARDHALQSAEKYEEAFKDTKGYYSGINAATMFLLGGVPEDMVKTRAENVLSILPDTSDLDAETLYFVEATRAEAHVLLEDYDAAQAAMRRAWDHDPLNFVAHASTLKQFRMIAAHRGKAYDWLTEYNPPKTVHYAGHIFGVLGESDYGFPVLAKADIEELKSHISDTIQTNDIGFGYGALAAGSDILIAETLLEEGCQLHVTLPVSEDAFIAGSVAPFGDSWVSRFKQCMGAANSVRIATPFTDWPDAFVDKCAGIISMGEALRQSQALSVEAGQLLIWDRVEGEMGTAGDAKKWQESGRPQYVIDYPYDRQSTPHISKESQYRSIVTLSASNKDTTCKIPSLAKALEVAVEFREEKPDICQGLDHELLAGESDPSDLSERLRDAALPGSILLSELAANAVTVNQSDGFETDFMGTLESGERIFALRAVG